MKKNFATSLLLSPEKNTAVPVWPQIQCTFGLSCEHQAFLIFPDIVITQLQPSLTRARMTLTPPPHPCLPPPPPFMPQALRYKQGRKYYEQSCCVALRKNSTSSSGSNAAKTQYEQQCSVAQGRSSASSAALLYVKAVRVAMQRGCRQKNSTHVLRGFEYNIPVNSSTARAVVPRGFMYYA